MAIPDKEFEVKSALKFFRCPTPFSGQIGGFEIANLFPNSTLNVKFKLPIEKGSDLILKNAETKIKCLQTLLYLFTQNPCIWDTILINDYLAKSRGANYIGPNANIEQIKKINEFCESHSKFDETLENEFPNILDLVETLALSHLARSHKITYRIHFTAFEDCGIKTKDVFWDTKTGNEKYRKIIMDIYNNTDEKKFIAEYKNKAPAKITRKAIESKLFDGAKDDDIKKIIKIIVALITIRNCITHTNKKNCLFFQKRQDNPLALCPVKLFL